MYFKSTKCYTLLLCTFLSGALMAKDAKTTDFAHGLRKPMCFVENKGQVMDQNNMPCADIQYRLATPSLNLFAGNGKLHYQFKKVEGDPSSGLGISTYDMEVTLEGANTNARIVAGEQQAYYENYFLSQLGNEGITAHAWNKIIYKDIYPSIDWVLYVKDNKVEYDFVVRPGGKVSDIKLVYDGATKLNITPGGSLTEETPMGIIEEKTPVAFETHSHKAVASRFVIKGNMVSFETGSYKGSLTIDPYLLWSTYVGGTQEDVVTSVKETTSGVTFVGGYTASTGIGTAGTYQAAHSGAAGIYDAFVAKYTNTGTLTYLTYFGGVANDQGFAIAVDPGVANPNVYLAGLTASNGLASGGAYHGAFGGGTSDGFLLKLNNTGNTRAFSTYYGGAGADQVNGVAVDASGNIYITGQTSSAAAISSVGAYQVALNGPNDAFLAKFNSAGAIQWSTYYGGTAQEDAYGIVLDVSNNIYITGQTNSIAGMTTAGAYQTVLNGTNDAFIAKFTNGGVRTWGTYYGGPGTEQGNGIAYDLNTGNIAIVGNTTSTSGIATSKAFQQVYGGGVQDAFLAYFNNSGSIFWSTYIGGPSLDYGQGVCFDGSENLIIAGGTFSSTGIASPLGTFTPNAFQPAIGGDYDAFVSKFNINGQSLWSTYFGGTLYDFANAVAYDGTNNQITIGGYSTSNGAYGAGGISTAGVSQGANAGGTYDGFVTKFIKDTLAFISQPYLDTFVCAGGTLTVNYSVNFNFQVTNTFTIQLSDITGSFASPINIGTLTSNAAGTVTCVIPAGTTPGTGYRIRLTASNPVYISPDNFYNITVLNSLPPTTASGTTPSCVGNTIQLFDNSTYSVANYSWTGPAGSGFGGTGFISTLQNPNNTGFSGTGATLADQGTYTVVTTHNGCPPSASTITIVVNNTIPPTPWDSSSVLNCVGDSINLFSNSDTAASVSFSWTGPGGFTSTLQNPVIYGITASNSGTYTLTDTLQGCPSVSASLTLSVTPTTSASVSISVFPGDTICQGTMVSFTAIPVNGGASPGYQWMTGSGSPIVGAVSATFSTSTLINLETVYCQMASTITCPSPVEANSNVIKFNVIDNSPIVAIYATPATYVVPGHSVSFTSAVFNGGVGPVYQWYKNGVKIPGANGTTYTLLDVTSNETISLVVKTIMPCAIPDSGISNAVEIIPTLAVGNVAGPLDNIELFPNPNTGNFTLKGSIEGIGNSVNLEIINLLGQLVYTGEATIQNNELNRNIDIANIQDGIYLLRINGGDQGKTFRFTVKR